MTINTCLLCGFPLYESVPGSVRSISCPVCGDYTLNEDGRANLAAPDFHLKESDYPALSHIARWVGQLDGGTVPPMGGPVYFPDAAMQLDNLVRYMGEHAGTPASAMQRRLLPAWQAIIGAPTQDKARRTLGQGEQAALVTSTQIEGAIGLSLTFDGWEKFRTLKRLEERHAALIIVSSPLDKVAAMIDRCIKPSLAAHGYSTELLQSHGNGADLRLIAMLRTAALMILDVSGTEDRPPWPTAIAHALGKPVLHLRAADSVGHVCEPENCLCGAPAIEWDMDALPETTARVATALRAISVAVARV